MTLSRLFARCILDDTHLRWQGFHDRRGYGRSHLAGTTEVMVHRIAYILGVGPISPGLTIDHVCGVQDCCTLEHLEPVTALENAIRARARRHETRFLCKRGHLYPAGLRKCKQCVNLAYAQRRMA